MSILSRFAALAVTIVGTGALAQVSSTGAGNAAGHDVIDMRVTNIIVPQAAGGHGLIVRPPLPPGGPHVGRIEVASIDANIDINDGVGTTTMRMTIKNPGGTQEEAQLLVPVPDGAAIRTFGFEGPGQEPTAKILPKEEARRIYEEIVRRSRDPALLEFVGYTLVRSSVFPVPANGTQTITLTYENVLPRDGERIDFALPRTASLEESGTKWSIKGRCRVSGNRAISTVYSPSHQLSTRKVSEQEVAFEVPESASGEPGAFRVSCLLGKAGDGITATILAYPETQADAGQGGYFLLLAGVPGSLKDRDKAPQKREVMIVIDRSGSMRGEKIEQARKAAIQVVEGLNPGEAFNIIDYSDTIAKFAEKPVVKTDKTLADARAYIGGLQSEGGTNIHDALQEAMRQPVTDGMLPMVLFLTDGLATVGVTGEVQIRQDTTRANTAKRRIFTFGVGYDVNAPLLDRLAESARGASINVLPKEDIEVAVSKVFKRLAGPVMSEPVLGARLFSQDAVTTSQIHDAMPPSLPDLFEGDQLVVLGRYRKGEKTVFTLRGQYLGADKTFTVEFDPATAATTRNAFVPRLWASRKIAFLLDEIRQSAAASQPIDSAGGAPADPRTKELVQEIVRLSQRWGILTEYTAFLATEPGVAVPVAVTPSQKDAAAGDSMRKLADVRAGTEGVQQSINLKSGQSQACANSSNSYWGADMQMRRISTVQQIHDQTLFCRGNRWVDSSIVDSPAAEKPDRIIEFGSAEHFDLARRLAADGVGGKAALLAMRGEVLLVVDGQKCLVKAPEGTN